MLEMSVYYLSTKGVVHQTTSREETFTDFDKIRKINFPRILFKTLINKLGMPTPC